MTRLLITGGAGFIGSHTCVVLLEAGFELVVLDNFDNSCPKSIERVSELTKCDLHLVEGDIRDDVVLNKLFVDASESGHPIEAVIHFAGLKAVGESVAEPLLYWDVNVVGSRNLLAIMGNHDCHTLVFSSTSTIYGEPTVFPLLETMQPDPIHPYAQSKLSVEQMLRAISRSGPWRVAALRYFNPVGAHPSGQIGEDPLGTPNNLFPFITQVACGRRDKLRIFGSDYPTPDGTGIRDYLHVMDLAEAHAAALRYLLNAPIPTSITLNIGTGQGLSVLDVIKGFEKVTGLIIPYEIGKRRPGDVPRLEGCPEHAAKILGWRANRGLEEMCRDGWAWQSRNPKGYRCE